MSAFELYAQYYDETYSDKDYVSEAKFVDRLLQEFQPGAKSISISGAARELMLFDSQKWVTQSRGSTIVQA